MMPFSIQMNMPLNLMALYGSFAIVGVLLLRVVLGRPLPKAVFPALWVMVMVRLLIPFSISSPLSYRPAILPTLKPPSAFKLSHGTSESTMTMVPMQTTPQIDWSVVVAVLFGIGVVVTVVVLLLQKRYYDKRLGDCLPLTENRAVNDALREMGMESTPVFTCDNIQTPLVHGLLRPCIYLPTEMNFTESKLVRHILLHELVHIRQKHNWLKTAMLVVLCLNWYNPLVWVMAHCMGADLESACDAAVMKLTAGNERHDYAKSLLAMSVTEKRPALLYSSFAKTAVEQRIKGVLRYRKVAIPVLVASVLLLGACTLREDATDGIDAAQVESRIAELKAATMELVTQSIASNSVGENQSRLKALSDEIKALCDMLAEYKQSYNSDSDIKMRMNEITEILENEPEESTTYNDTLVRQLIQTIKVIDEEKLEITFKCGMKYEQNITPTVRKINKAS